MPAPGSTVTTALRTSPPAAATPASGTAFLASVLGFGPLGWFAVRSVAEALALYGQTAMFLSGAFSYVRSYFEAGGSLLYLSRVVGAAAEAAELVLEDRNDPAGAALTITAASPGAWANAITVEVEDGTTAGTWRITFDAVSTGDAMGFQIIAGASSVWPVVIDNLPTPSAGAGAIAAHPVLGALVTVAVNNAGTDPDDRPAVVGPVGLGDGTAGTDNTAGINLVDHAAPADLGAGVHLGLLAAQMAAADPDELLELLQTFRTRNRIVFIDPSPGDTLSDYTDDLDTIAASLDAAIQIADSGEFLDELRDLASLTGGYYPQVTVNAIGGQATPMPIPASGLVAGLRARAHATDGPHRPPAGEAGILPSPYVVALDTATGKLTDAEAAAIDAAGLNAIRDVAGTLRVYGYQPFPFSGGGDPLAAAWPLLTHRDTINAIAAEADAIAERYVLRPIDPRRHVFTELERDLRGLGERYAAAGSLYARRDPITGVVADPGYVVDTGPEVNTAETIDAGQINGRITVRVTPAGETATIVVSKVATTTAAI